MNLKLALIAVAFCFPPAPLRAQLPGSTAPAPVSQKDLDARKDFLLVENLARLPDADQSKHVEELYRNARFNATA